METCRSLRKREVSAKRWESHKEANSLPVTEGLLCASNDGYCRPTVSHRRSLSSLTQDENLFMGHTWTKSTFKENYTKMWCHLWPAMWEKIKYGNTLIAIYSKPSKWAIFNPEIHVRIYVAQIIRRALESSDENSFTAVFCEARSLEKLEVTSILQ